MDRFLDKRDVASFQEVNEHTSFDDGWLIIHGNVYNITPFLKHHPGGSEILM